MDQHSDGLNFVPRLLRNSSPTPMCTRTRLIAKKSQNSLVYYNGNYEGDTTMFGERPKLDAMPLIEPDGDTECQNDMEWYKESDDGIILKEKRNICQLVVQYICHFLSPELILRITGLTEKCLQSSIYGCLKFCGKCTKVCCQYLIRAILFFGCKLGLVSRDVWSFRIFLRSLIRRLLWWLTLAKCGDLTLFAIVLISAPLLLVMAVVGFLLSLYSLGKDFVKRMCTGIINFFD